MHFQLSDETMRLMKEKQIYAVPTFAISEYFAQHSENAALPEWESNMLKPACGGVQEADGGGGAVCCGFGCGAVPAWTAGAGDGADGAVRDDSCRRAQSRSHSWRGAAGLGGQIGQLKPGFYADVIAVQGNPLADISVLKSVSFVMKNGVVYKQ